MSDKTQPDTQELVGILGEVVGGDLGRRLPVPAEGEPLRPLIEAFNLALDAWRKAEVKARATRRELQEKLGTIEAQAAAIRELSTPVLEVRAGTLLVPVVGTLGPRRGAELAALLLPEIRARDARHVIVDVTGAGTVDAAAAGVLVDLVRAARLLGARCVVTGLQPQAAILLVTAGVDVDGLLSLRSLSEGIDHCFRLDLRERQGPSSEGEARPAPGPSARGRT